MDDARRKVTAFVRGSGTAVRLLVFAVLSDLPPADERPGPRAEEADAAAR